MKKLFKKTLCIAIVSALVFCLCAPLAQAKTAALSAQNWMSGLADNMPLYRINIPGSHDSAMAHYSNSTGNYVRLFGIPLVNSGEYACTQELTIEEQLAAGVRFFDLRFSSKKESLPLCHGDLEDVEKVDKALMWLKLAYPKLFAFDLMGIPITKIDTEFYAFEDKACQVPSDFETVMDHFKSFLKEHPSEALILKLKRENGDSARYLELLQKEIAKLKTEVNPSTGEPYLYMEEGSHVYTKMPTLAQVRGKALLLTPDYEAIGCGDNLEMYNGSGMGTYLGKYFFFHNHWDIGGAQKLKEVKNFIRESSRNPAGGDSVIYGAVLHTSSNKVMSESPKKIDEAVSKWLFAEGTLKPGRFYGWFLCDFITAQKSEKIWQTNFFEGE